MTTRIYFGSNQLGEVAAVSLQDALNELDLGTLEDYRRTDKGLWVRPCSFALPVESMF